MENVREAYNILKFGYVAAPILAGTDKFLHFLKTSWTDYLAPVFPQMLGISADLFMQIVGAIEIVAGIIVFLRPTIGAYIVAAWLFGIIVNLLLLGNYYDIALRDLGLMLGALALGRLAASLNTKGEVKA